MTRPTYPVTNLEDATLALDPNHTLDYSNARDAQLFIDRHSHALKRTQILLRRQNCTKILFSGSRGNGKSSELSKLAVLPETEREFWVINFSVREKLDISDLSHMDILFATTLQLLKRAGNEGLDISQNVQKRAIRLQSEVVTENESKEGAGVEVKGGVKETLMGLFSFEGKLSREEATRRLVRTKIEHKLSDITALIGELADDIKQI